jgi:hypothetical protein
VTYGHKNTNARGTEGAEAMHSKYKGLKLCGGQAALPFLNCTYTRRTSGHCLGTFKTGDNIFLSLPAKYTVSHYPALPVVSLSLSLKENVEEVPKFRVATACFSRRSSDFKFIKIKPLPLESPIFLLRIMQLTISKEIRKFCGSSLQRLIKLVQEHSGYFLYYYS